MKVREIMTTEVATAQPDSTLEEVASMMKEEDTGAIPVLDEDELVGIITDRDIVVRCIAEGKDATETNVEDILSEDLVTISPDDDVEDAARLMSERQIRRLPVVEEGELIGMISLGDIAVKEVDEEPATAALEGVSRGVKQTGRQAEAQRRGKAQPAPLAAEFEIEEEIIEFSTARGEDRRSEDRKDREMRLVGGQRGQGRTTSNIRGRASSGGPRGKGRSGAPEQPPRKGAKPAHGERTASGGISRQKKVTSGRHEAKASRRRRAS